MADLNIKNYKRPNVIWVICDQLRADVFGYRFNPNVNTPNIDNLCRNGMRFDNAVSGAPWCCPARAAVLTSLYPNQSGVDRTPSPLDPKIPTVANVFNDAGYHTGWVGKWHLDGSNSHSHYVGEDRRGGFGFWMGYENNDNQNETYVYGTGNENPTRLEGYETDSLTDVFINHIKEHVNSRSENYEPFFMTLSVQPPHNPYVPPTDIDGTRRFYKHPNDIKLSPNVPYSNEIQNKAKFDMAGYCGMVENVDMNVGRIRMTLKELGIDKDTYLIFFSDHGDCLGSHGQWQKSSPWEEAIKIPFIISIVGGYFHMKTGTTDSMINHVDIAPTTLGLCGIEIPNWMKGYDYSPKCISENRTERHENYKEEPDSVYFQQIPRKFQANSVNRAWRGVLMKNGYKYVCTPNNDWLLFNIKKDPYEMNNLCYNILYQNEKEKCHERLKKWIEDTGDTFEMLDISLN